MRKETEKEEDLLKRYEENEEEVVVANVEKYEETNAIWLGWEWLRPTKMCASFRLMEVLVKKGSDCVCVCDQVR